MSFLNQLNIKPNSVSLADLVAAHLAGFLCLFDSCKGLHGVSLSFGNCNRQIKAVATLAVHCSEAFCNILDGYLFHLQCGCYAPRRCGAVVITFVNQLEPLRHSTSQCSIGCA